ncbi:uncharacterized protein LOC119739659 [Patiria miniata]|uniref:Uncharacterized protein n=1 Tax=Patiria miniata TaxID=46514 RepID=A0A914B3J7_PATMI|nr:uncharacterized protein LOC119739659 [Patiria miniata]
MKTDAPWLFIPTELCSREDLSPVSTQRSERNLTEGIVIMTTPSPIPSNPEDDAILNDLFSSDRQETISQRRSSCKQTYLKGAPMDGGDAASSADHPENDQAVATSKRPLSAVIRDHIIVEGEMAEHKSQPDEDVQLKQLQEKDTKRYGCERLKETEEDLGFLEEENEIENLVKLVLQKVKMELILEKIRNSLSDEGSHSPHNSSGCCTDSSECSSSTDEDTGSVAVEGKELPNSISHQSEEAEQQLDELIRFVIEKQCRDLAYEKEVSDSSWIHETVVEGDIPTEDDKKEPGLDFQFHSVMRRLTVDRIEDCCWEDQIDIIDVIEEIEEVADEEQALEGLHEVSEAQDGVTEQPKENSEEVSHPLHHNGSESTMEVARIPLTTRKVPESYEVQELHDEVQGSHGEVEESHDVLREVRDEVGDSHGEAEEARDEVISREVRSNHSKEAEFLLQEVHGNEVQVQESKEEVNHFLPQHDTEAMGASEVPNEARGLASKEAVDENREVVFDDMKMQEEEQEDGSSSEDDDDDDDDLLTSGDDEELDTLVGFVINSASSSLMSNFDVFTFNKSSHFKEEAEVLEGDTVKDGEAEPLICSEDNNSGGKTVSEVSATGDISKAEDRSRQDVDNVGDEVGLVKCEGTGHEINEMQFGRESLAANLTASSVEAMHVTTDTQSQDATEKLLRAPEGDLPSQEETSRSLDITSTVIGPKVALTASDIASDSDDEDDDFYESETKPSVCISTAENDWECLAIQQVSKSQPHAWYPTFNTTHRGAGETLKKQQEMAGNHLDDESTLTKPSTIPSDEEITSSQSPSISDSTGTASNALSSHSQTAKTSAPPVVSSQAHEAHSGSTEKDSGVAVINDGLRKKILHLEQRLKELALELTFLGDRNWRLEAYIDCLIKTLEVLEVTDVVDLDEKTLPLYLFKVKVKAGYKLGSYNGIPSRALWSYNKEGRPPPYVDLSGWGDTDKPAKRPDPIDFTPTPSCDDDVGLSVSQMYRYERQLEELSTQNLILEAQLREAQELAQAFIDDASFPGAEQARPQSFQQQPQQKDQGVQTAPPHETLPQDLEVLQQQMQEMQEYHPGGEEFWQQPQQQQQIFTTATPQSQQPECYVVHEGKQYPLPLPQHIPPMQHQPLTQQQQQQHHHYQQFQHYQSELQPKQEQLQQPQPNWNNRAVQEETVLPSDWNSNEELALYDPLEWPTLTESQAQNAGHPHSKLGTTEPRQNQQPRLQPRPFANTGPVFQVSQSAATVSSDPTKDKSTLHSSLAQPASTGSIPNHEHRQKASYHLENKTKNTSSCSRGRRFESNNRGPARYNHRPLDQSRSGIDTVPRGQRQEESMRFDYWDPPLDHLTLSIPGEFPVSLQGEAWHHESPPFHNVRLSSAPSHNPPPPHHSRNMDRNRRFFQGDSVLDSYRPDFSEFQDSRSFNGDLSESVSAPNPTFKLEPGYKFDKFSSPPSTRGFSSTSSSTSVGGLPYSSRRPDKRSATPTRRGKPWSRAGSPRHSSCHSPLKPRANPEKTHSDSK